MATNPRRETAVVLVDQNDLQLRLRDYYTAVGSELGGYTINDLPLNVMLTVDDEKVFASFELVVCNARAEIELVVLRHEQNYYTEWYVLRRTALELVFDQYRLVDESKNSHSLTVATFMAV